VTSSRGGGPHAIVERGRRLSWDLAIVAGAPTRLRAAAPRCRAAARGLARWSLCAALAAVLVARPVRARADAPHGLTVNVPVTAAVAAGALALWGATELARGELTPATCRWCEPPPLDRHVRAELAWSNVEAAGLLSDVLVVTLPATLAGADYLLAGRDLRRASEDALVGVEAMALAAAAAQVAKFTVARRRPAAWAAGARASPDDDRAFFSGHVATAFAAAAAFGTVARLRGYRRWPAVYGAGFGAAAVVGYLRIAADEHWLTDVIAAGAVGTALGIAVPVLLHRGEEEGLSIAPQVGAATVGLRLSGRF
jgi:membrane-associated phospholipid phosphatase